MSRQKILENESEGELGSVISSAVDEDNTSVFDNLSASLVEIRKLKGVMGYILRSDSSAVIDLDDSEKIIQYAILSSQALESCQEMARLLSMGETESMIVEGVNLKVLCMKLGENKINVFMENFAAHGSIIEKLML